MMFHKNPPTEEPGAATELALTRNDRIVMLVIGAVGGIGLGFAVPWLAGLAARTPVIPFHDVLVWLGSFDETWLTLVRPLVGLVFGVAVAVLLMGRTVAVTVSDRELRIRRGRGERRIARDAVAGVYRDGSEVVVESAGGRRLLAEQLEGGRERIAAAFVRHGYPWEGG